MDEGAGLERKAGKPAHLSVSPPFPLKGYVTVFTPAIFSFLSVCPEEPLLGLGLGSGERSLPVLGCCLSQVLDLKSINSIECIFSYSFRDEVYGKIHPREVLAGCLS